MKDLSKYSRIWKNGAEVNEISAAIDNSLSAVWHSSYEGRRQDLFSHAVIFNEPSATIFSGRYDLLTGDVTSGLGSLSGINVFSAQSGDAYIAYISPSIEDNLLPSGAVANSWNVTSGASLSSSSASYSRGWTNMLPEDGTLDNLSSSVGRYSFVQIGGIGTQNPDFISAVFMEKWPSNWPSNWPPSGHNPVTTAAVYAAFADITNPNNPTYLEGPEYVYTIDWWNDETGDYGNGTYLAGAGPLDKTEDPDNGISSGSYVSMYMDDWENPIPLPSPSSEYMSWSSYNTSFTYTGERDHGVFFTQRIPTSITITGTRNVHYTDQYDQPKTDTGVFNATLTKKR